ncbi:hypothetical protein GFC01_11845 [Desulfofundulus thermobenzoicus]|uniref:Uncharacterized protein n=1 Tax=Desulfofundulus thermobenzoicus TaxID=29376 RepID=A0A6N7ITU4_9FIRM|nr:hypothetical protein [Desulfofundulus thermobenzoicus]MQL52939.1 hypothetical protein [Desulfofundulus thermobenzoicus]
MKALSFKRKTIISKKLGILLDELEEELYNTIKLLSQLKIRGLTDEQREIILGDLSASITHIHVHTSGLDELIMEEMEE